MSATLAERLKEARNARGMTQQALADALDITPAAISQWELGQTYPDCGKLPYLSRLLGVSLDWLFKGENPRITELPGGMQEAPASKEPAFCGFCGKHQDFVSFLLAGRSAKARAFICDECCAAVARKVDEIRSAA